MLSEQQQRIMGYFIEEAKDHLNTIEQGLLNLQGTIEDSEMVNEVFRAAHSVKGGAAMLGLTSIQHTAHRLEDYFKVLKECPQVRVDQKLETLFLRVFDSLQELLEQLQGPFGLTEDKATEVMAGIEPVFAELNHHLTGLVNQAGGTLPETLEAPVVATVAPPASLPVPQQPAREESVLQLIFQSDVPIQLREMLQLFKQPDTTATRSQLQDLCRRLAQPGEQLDLPAWCELLRSAQRAIANLNNSYRTLAPVVIKDVKQAQELVLAGRIVEIFPSEKLLALLPQPGSPDEEQLVDLDLANLMAAMDASDLDGSGQAGVTEERVEADQSLLADLPEASNAAISEPSDEPWLSNPFVQSPALPTAVVADAAGLDLGGDPIWATAAADEAIASDALNFMDLEMTPSTPDPQDQAGPDVGPSELNTLADLFEGELPDLGSTWQEEEILAADADRPSRPPASSTPAQPFSGASEATDGLEELLLDEPEEEDLSGLLNRPERSQEQLETSAGLAEELDRPDEASGLDSLADLDGFADLELEFDELQEPDLWDDASLTAFPGESAHVELEALNLPEANRANQANQFDLEQLLVGLEENAQVEADSDAPDFSGAELDDLSDLFGAAPPQDIDALFEELEQSTQPPNPDLPELTIAEANMAPETLMAELFPDAQAAFEPSSFDNLSAPFSLDAELQPEIDFWDSIETESTAEPQSLGTQTHDEATSPPLDADSLDFLNQSDELAAADQATNFSLAEPEAELPGDALLDLGTFDDIPEPIDDLESLFAEEGEFAAGADAAVDLPVAQPEASDDLFSDDLAGLELESLAGEEMLLENSELAQSLSGGETRFTAEVDGSEQLNEGSGAALDPLDEAIAIPAEEPAAFYLDQLPVADLDAEAVDFSLEESSALDSLELPLAEASTASVVDRLDAPANDEHLNWTAEPAQEQPADSIAADQEPAFEPLTLEDDWEWPAIAADDIAAENDAETIEAEAEANAIEINIAGDAADDAADRSQFDQELTELEAMLEPEVELALEPYSGAATADPERLIDAELDAELDPELSLVEEPAADLAIEADFSSEPAALVDPLPDLDDFADLEALLEDESVEPEAAPPPLVQLEADDGFGDLEALLQDADQTLGGGVSAPRSSRVPSIATNRRANRRTVFSDQTMRVTVKHLDNLNNLVGEMVVNRNSLEQAQERLRQFLDNLLYQVQQLNDVGQRMRDLYERSLLESSLLSSRRGSSLLGQGSPFATAQPSHATGMNFDALEMDRFTGFHTLSQEMIELIVRVRESASDIDFVVEESDQVTRNFRQITTQLQEGLNRSRMVPFAQTADRLPRGVRDNSLKYGKQAELVIEGRETLIDKMIVEQLYDPMTHLVNNAIAHGIETPEERLAAGKSPVGQITIRAFHQGNQTVISVSDDGAGIDPELVKAKAVAKGLITPAEARQLSRLDCYDLLFHHGFSTVDQVDDLRGRGVGLDVVQSNLNEIRGAITTDSIVGKGTTFTIRLPLTLSISKALCCINHRARIAFPMDGVEDMLDLPRDRVQIDEEGRSCIYWRDTLLPFQHLSDLLKYNRILGRGSVYGGNQEEDIISIVVLRSAGSYLAIQVDQVLGEQEIVIKQLEGPVPKPIGVAGATVLGDGRIMPIADVLELIDLWQGRIRRESGSSLWDKQRAGDLSEAALKTESTVLIVDDSITVRELLSMTFSKVGYRVEQARDGQEAWEKLRSGLPCDLVFCDIEMPRMDGLELLSRIQKDPHFQHLPIAMLTSRGADRHRQMAIQLGAKGYFTKPYLEEVLLDAAQRMLKGEVLVNSGQG